MSDEITDFYRQHHDEIEAKRERSPYWTRRFAYEGILDRMAGHVVPGESVLDAGCGEGSLATRLAAQGAHVVGVDISQPNLLAASGRAERDGFPVRLALADLTRLPFPDCSFDLVTSSHVIEHLPDPLAGLREIRRVAKGLVVIAAPTCGSPASWFLIGGATYWQRTRRSYVAPFVALTRTMAALVRGEDGPQEGYAGHDDLPHVWRFPWRLLSLIETAGLEIVRVEGGPFVLPYIGEHSERARRAIRWVDDRMDRPVLRYLGYGTHVIARPA